MRETKLNIRPATRNDVSLIIDFVRALAEYEREPNAVLATEADIIRDGFSGAPRFHCVIAEWERQPAGFAFYFFHYSTWLGRPGIYVEDLFVRPELREKGVGKGLLAHLAQIAIRENCYAMRWQVLDWNQPAIDFYEKLGAKLNKAWLDVRLAGEALERLATISLDSEDQGGIAASRLDGEISGSE